MEAEQDVNTAVGRQLHALVRAKAAYPKKRTATVTDVEVQCPHCKTLLRGGIGDHILRMACYHCKKPMNLLWQTQIEAKKYE